MAKKYTLDTNCILAIEETRPGAPFVRALVNAHAAGTAHVAIVAISASENPKTGNHIKSFTEFQKRLTNLNLAHLEVLRPMFYFNVTFFNWCLWADASMKALEREIHEVLFPNVQFLWTDYCSANNIDPKGTDKKWRNCKCDVQAMWSHLNENRDVFVTSDGNFHKESKKAALISMGAKQIEYPELAALQI